MDNIISDLVLNRFKLGRQRYSKGLLHPSNDILNYRHELIEELLDAVVYAAADSVRKSPLAIATLKIDEDDGSVKLALSVNEALDRDDDGTNAIYKKIMDGMSTVYSYDEIPSDEDHVLLLCLFTLCSVLKIAR
jgi:hypothetical protein